MISWRTSRSQAAASELSTAAGLPLCFDNGKSPDARDAELVGQLRVRSTMMSATPTCWRTLSARVRHESRFDDDAHLTQLLSHLSTPVLCTDLYHSINIGGGLTERVDTKWPIKRSTSVSYACGSMSTCVLISRQKKTRIYQNVDPV